MPLSQKGRHATGKPPSTVPPQTLAAPAVFRAREFLAGGLEGLHTLSTRWRLDQTTPDEWLTTQGEDSSTIPQLCLPQIHPNPRVPQFVEQSINGGHSVWGAHNIGCHPRNGITWAQFLRNCKQRILLPREQSWGQCIALLSALALGDVVNCALCHLPMCTGKGTHCLTNGTATPSLTPLRPSNIALLDHIRRCHRLT